MDRARRPRAGRILSGPPDPRRRLGGVWGVRRRALLLALPLAVLLLGARAPATPAVRAQEPAGPARFGLAHVDLMDLHVERRPEGGVADRELLPAEDLADRYLKAAAAGSGWNRWSLYWDMVERSPGAYEWAAADGIVRRDLDAGLRPLLILQGTPGFHAGAVFGAAPPVAVGGDKERYAPDALPEERGVVRLSPPPSALERPIFLRRGGGTTDDPRLADAVNPDNPWARFVDAAVERYRPGGELARALRWPEGRGVRHWEIGNEPNLEHFWSGTPAQFVRFLEVAYLVIAWRDPRATVVHGGIADDAGASAWFRSFLSALAAKSASSELPDRYGWYFDATAWHWYAYPDLLRSRPPEVEQMLAQRGLRKPLWVTEMGVPVWSEHPGPCWDPSSPWRASTQEQSAYAWQAFAEGLANGIETLIAFQTYDDCGNGPASYDAFGLLRNHASNQCWVPRGEACWRRDPALDGQPRPAYHAFQAAARELPDAELLWRPARDAAGWQRVLFYVPPNRRVMMLWNLSRRAQNAEVYATGPRARMLRPAPDGTIAETELVPAGGVLRIELPGATNDNNFGGPPLMAGHPVMIDEVDTAAPFRASLAELPETSPLDLELRVEAADGGTGVGAFQLYEARGDFGGPSDWRELGGERAWTADPLSGVVTVAYRGDPGQLVHFAVRAADRAGSWTDLPDAPQTSTRFEGPTPTPGAASATPGSPASPTASATPTAAASPSATPTPRPSPTATPAGPPSATPSPAPLLPRLWLPLTLRDGRLQGPTPVPSSTPAPTMGTSAPPTATALPPACRDTELPVLGPWGDDLRSLGGLWWLRARLHEGWWTEEAPVGEPICMPTGAEEAAAWAALPGYVAYPPQRLASKERLHLAVAPGALRNGTFESGLAAWEWDGRVEPAATDEALSGAGAAVLGGEGGGTDVLVQRVRVPDSSPVLAFEWRFESVPTCDEPGAPCRELDRLYVSVQDLERPGQPATVLDPLGEEGPLPDWSHRAFDLAPWSGREVELGFVLVRDRGQPGRASRLWLDNLSVSPARP